MKPIVCFERTHVSGQKPGTAEDREAFQERFHGVFRTSMNGFQFNVPGVFQVGGSVPILVLPWVIANATVAEAIRRERQDPATDLLNAIFDIQYLFENEVASFSSVEHLGAELLLHSFLTRLKDAVERALQFNYFNNRVEELASIRGRWLHSKDLATSLTPTRFTCEFEDVSAENPILRCVRFMSIAISALVASNINAAYCVEIERALHAIPVEGLSEQSFVEARSYIDGHPRFEEWRSIIEFGSNLISYRADIIDRAGTSYVFPMDQFFEVLVASVFRIGGGKVRTQVRKPLLGRSFWLLKDGLSRSDADEDVDKENTEEAETGRQLGTNHHARPDVVYETSNEVAIIECKYKPLTFPGTVEKSRTVKFSSIGRNDRNQVLSFLLSLEPSEDYEGRRVHFVVIYPYVGDDDVRTIDLIFPYVSLKVDRSDKAIVQSIAKDEANCWKIRFVGINVQKILTARGTPIESTIALEVIRTSTG